jgi:hypothetical protein
MTRTTTLGVLGGVLGAGLVACSAVLGLDPPSLDPCASGGCADAADDAPAAEAASDAGADVGARDARSDAPVVIGIRCGGGNYPETMCVGQTPMCCQTTTQGTTSYDCRATAAACDGGYPIACSSNADCMGNDVCCHYSSSIKCEPSSACANASLVCEPDGAADQCPTGWRCAATEVNQGVPSPYYACMQ